jgi:cell division transport system permease protein
VSDVDQRPGEPAPAVSRGRWVGRAAWRWTRRLLLLVAALVAFATASALAGRRSDVELLHLIGADDRQIARPYAARSLVYGLIGSGIAAAATHATVAALGSALGGTSPLIRLAAPTQGIGLGDWRLWLVLAATTLVAGILAAASARATVRRHLARLP